MFNRTLLPTFDSPYWNINSQELSLLIQLLLDWANGELAHFTPSSVSLFLMRRCRGVILQVITTKILMHGAY